MRTMVRALLTVGFVGLLALPARADYITDGVSGALDFTVFVPEVGPPDALSSSVWTGGPPAPVSNAAMTAVPLATGTDAPITEAAAALPSIPEPATLLLFGSGLAVLRICLKRRA